LPYCWVLLENAVLNHAAGSRCDAGKACLLPRHQTRSGSRGIHVSGLSKRLGPHTLRKASA